MKLSGPIAGLSIMAGVALTGPVLASATGNIRNAPAPAVSERVARDIAWSLGIVRIDEIALAGARWEIAGRDQEGNERSVDISAYDGRPLN